MSEYDFRKSPHYKSVALKYFALATQAADALWKTYVSVAAKAQDKKAAYKLVNAYHEKVRKVFRKYSAKGIAELQRIDSSGGSQVSGTYPLPPIESAEIITL